VVQVLHNRTANMLHKLSKSLKDRFLHFTV
jgi:hypothetical protein